MARDPRHDVLFEPIRIGPKTMRNRFYQTPHCSGLADEPAAHAHFRGLRAEGGWALVNTEYCSIHPESDDRPWRPVRLWNANDVRNLSLMTEKVHEHGALAGVELHFGGAHHTGYDSRLSARAVSQIPSDAFWQSCPWEMDREAIRELQDFYAAAAERARQAGFDSVVVYGGEASGVPLQFLMRYFNKRTDEYGGSLENRARFWRETLERVREAVGDELAIVARFAPDSLRDDDLGLRVEEDGVRFVEHVDHLVDLWDIQLGGPTVEEWIDATGPSRFRAENWQKPWVDQLRAHTKKPIVGVGRFTNPDTMVAAIRSGQLDVIGAARPAISDPFLPRKIEEGRLEDIRECIGCNICGSRFNQGASRIVCTQNATSTEEYRRGWHPERFERARNADSDVLVVGAGPAGMECARVLGERGMRRVHLVEALGELGGSMRWIPRLPGLGEWGRVVNYRKIQLDKLRNVEVLLDLQLAERDVLEYGAELVVIATGSRWRGDGIAPSTHAVVHGADPTLPHVLTPEQVMLDGKEVGERVLVYDGEGYFMGLSLAEKLAREGRAVTVVTPFWHAGPYLFFTGEGIYMNRLLRDLGVEFFVSHAVDRIEAGSVVGHEVLAPERPVEWRADSVLLTTGRISDDALYRRLKADRDTLEREGIAGLFRIGDCKAPRQIAEAVYDGHRLAREIDSDDPSTPLPYVREARILGATDDDYEAARREAEEVGFR